MVHRQFRDIDKKSFLVIHWTTLGVCNRLQAWCPYLKGDIEHLEKVQRRATKLISGYSRLSYEPTQEAQSNYTLRTRRLRGDLIETYKIITGKENIKSENIFSLYSNGPDSRGHCLKLATTRSRLELRRNFFSHRVISNWNSLPAHVMQADTVNSFKNRLAFKVQRTSQPVISKYKYKYK